MDIFGAVYIDEVARQGDGSLKPSDLCRYTDDTWDIEEVCDDHMVKNFTNYLNETILKDKIKFEPVTKDTGLEFLDVKVHLKNGYLIPEIYSKETDSHEYLNPNSAHPLSVTKNNPYSVALRVRRNCSDREVDDKLFINNLIQYKAYLMPSGYDEEAIDKQFIKVAKMKRKETLESKPRKNRFRPKQRKYNFVTTWDTMFPDIGRVIRKFVPLLAENEECNKLFPKGSFRMAYKRGRKNLKEILAPSTISTLEGELGRNSKSGQCKKCQKCGTSGRGRKRSNGLNNCAVLEEGNTFCSKVTKDKYIIRQEINCHSRNVIYLVNCMKCPKQGVGKTETFQARISNYISHIIQQKQTCWIVKHFLYAEGHSVEDFRIMGILRLEKPPKSPKDLKKMLKEFEGYWQIKLQTLEPYGMNFFDEFYNAEYHDKAGRSYLSS